MIGGILTSFGWTTLIRIVVRVELWTGWKIPQAASRYNQFLKHCSGLPSPNMRSFFLFVKIDTSDLEGAKAILRVTAKEERWPRLKCSLLIFKVWRFT